MSTNMTRATKGRRVAITVLLLAVFCVPSLTAIKIRVTGKWQENLRVQDLAGGAGTDFTYPFESAENEVRITISKTTTPTTAWKVEVKRIDTNWHPSLVLSVKRTSDHAGVSGGTDYIEIETTDKELFTGSGEVSQIDLKFSLEGVSAGVISADDYTTEVHYTVTEL